MRASQGSEGQLADWRQRAIDIEDAVKRVIVGQEHAVRLLSVATLFCRHVILEGDVGVGKTTLLGPVARAFCRVVDCCDTCLSADRR